MDGESSDGAVGDGGLDNGDFSDLLDMFKQISNGYHTLAEETIHTEEKYLEFVRQMETNVRQPWNAAEFESRRLRTEIQATENEHVKSGGIMKNIRQQLQSEMDHRTMAEARVKDLEGLLNTFREMLGGDRTLTDEERQRLYDSTEEFRRNNAGPSNIWTGVRKSEDIDADRISFDRSDDEGLEEEDEMPEPRHERVSQTRRVVTRTSDGESSKFMRIASNGDGDIEIIAKTHVHISENGPVNAQTFLTAKPRKSVGFSEPVSSMLNVNRRSHSVPRFMEDTDGNRIRRSREEAELLSSEVGSQASDVESLSGDFTSHGGASSGTANPLSRRRSKSLGKGLDGRQHNFLEKMYLGKDVCSVCKQTMSFASMGRKCSACRAVCHTRCAAAVPIPCVPYVSNPMGNKSGGQIWDLEKMAPVQRPRVPAVVAQCIRFIEANGLTEEGLYRVSGQHSAVSELKKRYYNAYKKNPKTAIIPDLGRVSDVHVVTGFLKNFIMSLKEPLLTYQLWNRFASAGSTGTNTEFYKLVDQLPVPNRDVLACLMQHFRRVSDSPTVRMPIDSLQKILAPTLIGNSTAGQLSRPQANAELLRQQLIIAKLFGINRNYWTDIMASDPKLERPSSLRYSGDGLSGDPLLRNESSIMEFYDAPEDWMVTEGGGGMRGVGNNSFTNMARSFFGSSNSKNTVSEVKTKTSTLRPAAKFQSPLMSD